MAKKPGNLSDMRERAAKAGAAVGASSAAAVEPKPRVSPLQFMRQVQAEGKKITWPSRKETYITSVMVFIMVVVASLFFWGVDTILALAMSTLLNLVQ